MPKRIQRKRTKGWKMPPNTVYVGRPTKWGNPYRLSDYCHQSYTDDGELLPPTLNSRRWNARNDFENAVRWNGATLSAYPSKATIIAELCGKDLACWCPLDQPCHADVLLEIANGAQEEKRS